MVDESQSGEPQNVQGGAKTPPYVSFSTFKTFLGDLKEHGVPPQIDRSVMPRFSGGVQGQLMAGLKALGLVEDNDSPTPALGTLVRAYDTENFPDALRPVLQRTYPYVLALDLQTATPSMYTKAFSENLSAKEEVLRKVRTFFMLAAKEANIKIGSRIETAKFPRSKPPTKKAPPKPAKTDRESREDKPQVNVPPVPVGGQITEKALEYRLVDLMSDAVSEPEVMAAIVTIITFLKTKEANSKGKEEV